MGLTQHALEAMYDARPLFPRGTERANTVPIRPDELLSIRRIGTAVPGLIFVARYSIVRPVPLVLLLVAFAGLRTGWPGACIGIVAIPVILAGASAVTFLSLARLREKMRDGVCLFCGYALASIATVEREGTPNAPVWVRCPECGQWSPLGLTEGAERPNQAAVG